jgi:nucleoside-diphosphate-sugar epimerase
MLVCVTGGTGFVGAHSVAALVRAGHRVRLLARAPERVRSALTPLHVDPAAVEVVPGDVTDADSVAAAVRGADGVLHAAAVFSFDSRQRAAVRRTGALATELVLAAAHRAGADPIVHVSSFGALLPSTEPSVGPDSPVGRPRETYLASKAAGETIARQHQAAGAPVAISYPPALLGPHDPHLGDQNRRLRDMLRGLMPIWPTGGLAIGDVRDTAALHASLFAGPRSDGAARYFGPSHYVTTRQFVRAVRETAGRALPTVFLPPALVLPVGRLVDVLQRVVPWHLPAEYGAIYTVANAVPISDDADTRGLRPRPLADTLADTVRWLCQAGHLSPGRAGTLGARPVAIR